jgi:hypothetical protein
MPKSSRDPDMELTICHFVLLASRICKHTFSKEGIVAYLEGRSKPCPMTGTPSIDHLSSCIVRGSNSSCSGCNSRLSPSDLQSDKAMERMLSRLNYSQQMSRDEGNDGYADVMDEENE